MSEYLSKGERKVLDFIRVNDNPQGITQDRMIIHFGKKQEIRLTDILILLSQSGLIYEIRPYVWRYLG